MYRLQNRTMTDERIKNLEEKMDFLIDSVSTALIAARESTTPSFSKIMQDFIQRLEKMEAKMDEHGVKLDEHMIRTQPVVDTIETAKNMKKAVIWISGFLLAIYPITHAFKVFKDWVK